MTVQPDDKPPTMVLEPTRTYVSAEEVWRARVIERRATAPSEDGPATWEGIQEQRRMFEVWQPGSALFVDAVNSIEHNLAQVLDFIAGTESRRE